MAITKILAGVSLVLLALAAAPVAQAENAADGTTVAPPQKTVTPTQKAVDPAKKAARQAKKKQQREMQPQMRTQQPQGSAPTTPSGPTSN
jgi:hypothetical protein